MRYFAWIIVLGNLGACQSGDDRPTIYLPDPNATDNGTVDDSAQSDIAIIKWDSTVANDWVASDGTTGDQEAVDTLLEPDLVDSAEMDVAKSVDIIEDIVTDTLRPCEDTDCEVTAPVIQISAGDHHTCVLRDNGSVWCFGHNWWGSLGDGNIQTSSENPISPTGLPPAVQVAAGGDTTCALDTEEHVWCWGKNGSGEVGNGEMTWAHPVPSKINNFSEIGWIAAGGVNSGALTKNGVVYMWGRNVQGQLGTGTTDDSAIPKKTVTNVLFNDLEIGSQFTCGVAKQGDVYCWGSNNDGDLGTGGINIGGIHTPVQVIGLVDAMQVASGDNHSCALRKTGTVKCWGSGKSGQLGDGTYVNSYTSGTVPGIEDVIDIAAGSTHSCAVLKGGTVWCWGNNDSGRLGNGTTKSSAVPGRAKWVNDAIQVTCGAAHTCALRKNGAVMCWGSNKYGQLGTGTKESSLVPIPAAALN